MARLTHLQTAAGILTLIGVGVAIVANLVELPATSNTVAQSRSAINAGRDAINSGASQRQASSDNSIYQAGVPVGRVFVGRRSPEDAALFEFQEITNASLFNTQAEFEYQDFILTTVSFQMHTGLTSSRPQDGPIISSLVAKVIKQK
jgi:hypothetical protein